MKKGDLIMKKTYISPNTLVMTITPATVITASRLNSSDASPYVTVTFEDGGYDGEFCSRRGGSIWDDED